MADPERLADEELDAPHGMSAEEEALAARLAGTASPAEANMTRLLAGGMTSSDLLGKQFAPMKWLVPELIPAEGLTVLGAKMGLGKSFFLLQLAAALSTGSPFLGRDTERQGVLLIALEDSERRINARLQQLQAIGTDRLLIYTRWQKGKAALEDLRLLLTCRRWIRVVVVDPIVKWLELTDFDDYGSAYGALGPLKDCLDAHRAAGLFAHHCRKSVAELDAFDDLLGSTGWGASCDSRLVLRRNRGSDDAVLVAGGRDVMHSESALHFDMDQGWTYQGSAEEVRMSDARKDILDLLAREGPLSGVEVARILDKNENTIRTLLRRLAGDGRIVQDVDRRWNSRNAVTDVTGHGGEALNERQNVETVTGVTGVTGAANATHTTERENISHSLRPNQEAASA